MQKYKYLSELKTKSTAVLLDHIIQKHFKVLLNANISQGSASLEYYSELDLIALDQWAQRILLLAKYCEPTVLKNAYDAMSESERRLYSLSGNECDRFLWAFQNKAVLFDAACKTLPNSILRDERSSLICTMYSLPQRAFRECNDKSLVLFREALEDILWYSRSDIVITCDSIALSGDGCSSFVHDISVTYNTLDETIKSVKDNGLVYTNITRSKELYIVFHENDGLLEVYAPSIISRDDIAEAFSKTVLKEKNAIRKLFYHFQYLANPVVLPLFDESIKSAKITEIKFRDRFRMVESSYFLNENTKKNIHDVLSPDHSSDSNATLSGVSIALDIGRTRFLSQTTSIEFLGPDSARIYALTPRDRWLWHKFLANCEILQGVACAALPES